MHAGEAPKEAPARDLLREDEARARAAVVTDVSYTLDLQIRPEDIPYQGRAVIRFGCRPTEVDTFLDFRGGEILSASLNGEPLEAPPPGAFRIPLPASRLREGNEVVVSYRNAYDRHGAGFHRFQDPEDGEVYLYTDFEPYCAHRLFPCFDQPDLKATYELSVTAPENWRVVSNGAVVGVEDAGDGRTRRTFDKLPPFSTYLFCVVAGPYEEVREKREGLDLGLYVRKALKPFLDPEEIFEVTRQGFRFYQDTFACPYPFRKYDQIFVPEFNSGAMENVACVTFHESNVFRDPPTETQRLRRAEVILHELAHMWFGNLVTMRWWNGLWLNESFATYISFLAMSEATRFSSCWENFLGTIKAWALRQDEKPTTHPIAGQVEDTDQTFLNFDGITYGKGAAVLKQLRAYVGPHAFEKGLRAYFERHAYGNTDLEDFLAPLSEASGKDLKAWSARWLETSGVNTITPVLETRSERIERALLRQEPGNGDSVLRPHLLHVGFFDEEQEGRLVLRERVEILLEGEEVEIPGAAGQPEPALLWANLDDHGYAKVALDPASLAITRRGLHRVPDPLVRAGLWLTLWNMTRDARLAPAAFLEILGRSVTREEREEVVQNAVQRGYAALFRYLDPTRIEASAEDICGVIRTHLEASDLNEESRRLWSRHLITLSLGRRPVERILGWLDGELPGGLPPDQGMRWRILIRGCAHGFQQAFDRLDAEKERDPTDRGGRAHFAARHAWPDATLKREAFDLFVQPGAFSTDVLKHAMSAFFWPHQEELLEPFALEYLEVLPRVLEKEDLEYATRGFARLLFPHPIANARILESARNLLEATPDSRSVLKRILLEECDEMERIVRLRGLGNH